MLSFDYQLYPHPQSFDWILKLFFQQVFPKMMFWPSKDVCKYQTLWDQKIWCLPSEYMLSAHSKPASFSSLAKKRKSCAFLIQSFWFTVFLFFHFGVKHCFHDTGLKLKALCISFALKKLDTALLVSDQWCIVNLFQGDHIRVKWWVLWILCMESFLKRLLARYRLHVHVKDLNFWLKFKLTQIWILHSVTQLQ